MIVGGRVSAMGVVLAIRHDARFLVSEVGLVLVLQGGMGSGLDSCMSRGAHRAEGLSSCRLDSFVL